jgi:hypothetical protein
MFFNKNKLLNNMKKHWLVWRKDILLTFLVMGVSFVLIVIGLLTYLYFQHSSQEKKIQNYFSTTEESLIDCYIQGTPVRATRDACAKLSMGASKPEPTPTTQPVRPPTVAPQPTAEVQPERKRTSYTTEVLGDFNATYSCYEDMIFSLNTKQSTVKLALFEHDSCVDEWVRKSNTCTSSCASAEDFAKCTKECEPKDIDDYCEKESDKVDKERDEFYDVLYGACI